MQEHSSDKILPPLARYHYLGRISPDSNPSTSVPDLCHQVPGSIGTQYATRETFDKMGTRQFLPSWNRNNIPETRNEANEIVQALCGMHLFTHVDIAQLQSKDVHSDGAQAAGRRRWRLGLMEELGVLGQADEKYGKATATW